MFEYLIGGFILGIFAGMAIVNTWNYFWDTHGEKPFLEEQLNAHIDFVKQYQRQVAALEAPLKQAMDAFGLTWGDLEGFGSACEGIADTMEKDQADNLRFVIANAEVANLNADLQIENIRLQEIETESAAVIAMARSFANFPSWLENLEAALASDDLSKLTTQQKPTLEAMLRANPSCGMDGCLWERING